MKLFILSNLILVYCFTLEIAAEANSQHAIFISEEKMKKHRKQNQPVTPISAPGMINGIVSQNLQKNTDISQTAGVRPEAPKQEKNGSSVLFSGWVKFLKYNENVEANKTPKLFTENNLFFEQPKLYPNQDLNVLDIDGQAKFIRDKNYFWLNVFKGSVNIISSKTVRNFNLE
jgi:hypothetical protein